jgi:hypothetical protein
MVAFAATVLILQIITIHSLENFIDRHFQDETVVLVSSDFGVWGENLDFLLRRQDRPKVIANPGVPGEMITPFKNFVFVEADFDHFVPVLGQLRHKFNTRGQLVVIFHENSTEDDLKSTFETLWSYYVYNVVVYANLTRFVTWYPYSSASRCGSVVNLVTNAKSPFANKIPKDLGGCPVNITWNRVSYVVKIPFDDEDPGYAVKVLNTIGEKMNVKMVYLNDNINYFSLAIKYGTFHHLVQDMTRRHIDVALTIGDLHQGKKVETGQHILLFGQYFVLPPRKRVPRGGKFLEIFSDETWWSILVSVVSMSIVWRFVTGKELIGSVFYVVQLAVQNVVKQAPKSTTSRLIFVTFLLSATTLNWCYLSQLSSVLTEPSYEPKIQTISDLVKSDKKLRFWEFYKDHFATYGREICENLMNRRVENSDSMTHSGMIREFVADLEYGVVLGEIALFQFKNPKVLQVLSYDNVLWHALVKLRD